MQVLIENENDDDRVDGTPCPERTIKNRVSSPRNITWSGWMRNAWARLQQKIASEGQSFCSNLQHPQDINTIKLARFLFHSCSLVPPILYYSGTVETPPKFPATISYTIRKGLPQKAQMVLWMSGWACMYHVIRKRSSLLVRRFCTKMFLTGIWTTVVFRLGQGPVHDVCHAVGAAVYMLDHAVLLKILNTRPFFRKMFYSSFAIMLYALAKIKSIEQITGLVMESSDSSPQKRQRILSKFPKPLRRSLFRWELMLMVFENLLFASFVHGMPSGLQDDIADRDDEDNIEICDETNITSLHGLK